MFRRLASKFRQFMLGRRGIDTLGMALVILYIVLTVVSDFMFHPVAYLLVSLVSLVVLVWFFYRFFSRNLVKREAENRKFAKVWTGIKNRLRDRKTHRYFVCPACKNTLRVPRGRGNITVTCPVCKEQLKRRT